MIPSPLRRGLAAALALSLGAAAAAGEDAAVPVPPEAQVVWLGEVHDNPAHHAVQAATVAALAPAALVFEMLTPDQTAAAPADRADAAALGAAFRWEASGWPPFALYAPVFAAAPEAALYGAARPPDAARRAVGEGALAVFGADGARFGLDAALPDAERALRERGQAEAHCGALPEAMLGGMVEAQRLRDADLAAAALAALEATGGPVAVVAGTGHVRTDWGAPALLARAAPEVRQFALGQVEAAVEGGAPFDAVRVAEPPERGDPCAAFRPGRGRGAPAPGTPSR